MAEMRFRTCSYALVGLSLLVALPVAASADPKPIERPANTAPLPAPPPPPPQPATPPPAPPAPPPPPATPSGSTSSGSSGTGSTQVDKPAVVTVIVASGGRDQSNAVTPTVAPAEPVTPAAPPAPDPTPLGLVAASERGSSHGASTPPWKLALLALLAAAEAFLVVRLIRHRPGALSTAH